MTKTCIVYIDAKVKNTKGNIDKTLVQKQLKSYTRSARLFLGN